MSSSICFAALLALPFVLGAVIALQVRQLLSGSGPGLGWLVVHDHRPSVPGHHDSGAAYLFKGSVTLASAATARPAGGLTPWVLRSRHVRRATVTVRVMSPRLLLMDRISLHRDAEQHDGAGVALIVGAPQGKASARNQVTGTGRQAHRCSV